MSEHRTHSRTILDVSEHWFPILCRLAIVLIVSIPAVGKFSQYPRWVSQFETWGILWPEVAVLLVGAVQIVAMLSLVVGVAGRAGASVLALVMLVAMATAGPTPPNVIVLGSSLVVAVRGTGPYSAWDPRLSELFEVVESLLPTHANGSS